MKHFKEVTIPAKKELKLTHTSCDICEKEVAIKEWDM